MNSPEMHLARAGLDSRPCETCGIDFTPKRRWARFCSTRCRNAWHGWTRTVKEARKLVFMALTSTVDEEWKKRAGKLLGIKEPAAP